MNEVVQLSGWAALGCLFLAALFGLGVCVAIDVCALVDGQRRLRQKRYQREVKAAALRALRKGGAKR